MFKPKQKDKTLGKMLVNDLFTTLRMVVANTPYESKTWRLFRVNDGSDKRYTVNNLGELFEDIRQRRVTVEVMHYGRGTVEEALKDPEVIPLLQTTSGINLRDFIYACCQDRVLLDRWKKEITAVIMAPVSEDDPVMVAALHELLYHAYHVIIKNNNNDSINH